MASHRCPAKSGTSNVKSGIRAWLAFPRGLITYLGIASTIGCSGNIIKDASQSKPAKRIMVGERYYAGALFGSQTRQVSHRFYVRNTLDRPFRILGETHSCTCTSVEIDQRVLLPGEATPLIMTISVPLGYSHRDISCIVKTDAPSAPELNYTYAFESYPNTHIIPAQIYMGAAIDGDGGGIREQEAWLEIFAKRGARLPEPGTVQKSDEFDVEIDEMGIFDVLSGGVNRARYRLTIRPRKLNKSTGEHSRLISIETPSGPPATSTVHWKNNSSIVCIPTSINFGIIKDDSKIQKMIIISSTKNEKFGIREIASDTEFLMAQEENRTQKESRRRDSDTLDETLRSRHVINLTLIRNPFKLKKDIFHNGIIYIKIKHPTVSELKIHWSAFHTARDGSSSESQASEQMTTPVLTREVQQ